MKEKHSELHHTLITVKQIQDKSRRVPDHVMNYNER